MFSHQRGRKSSGCNSGCYVRVWLAEVGVRAVGGTSHLPLHSAVPGTAAEGAESDRAQEAWGPTAFWPRHSRKQTPLAVPTSGHIWPITRVSLGLGAQVFEMCWATISLTAAAPFPLESSHVSTGLREIEDFVESWRLQVHSFRRPGSYQAKAVLWGQGWVIGEVLGAEAGGTSGSCTGWGPASLSQCPHLSLNLDPWGRDGGQGGISMDQGEQV